MIWEYQPFVTYSVTATIDVIYMTESDVNWETRKRQIYMDYWLRWELDHLRCAPAKGLSKLSSEGQDWFDHFLLSARNCLVKMMCRILPEKLSRCFQSQGSGLLLISFSNFFSNKSKNIYSNLWLDHFLHGTT